MQEARTLDRRWLFGAFAVLFAAAALWVTVSAAFGGSSGGTSPAQGTDGNSPSGFVDTVQGTTPDSRQGDDGDCPWKDGEQGQAPSNSVASSSV
ncbi:MAG: hypothetical protein H0T39_05180 [Actinobacteria bacterium]|nr:hypothetical protein [Actinomycetota bacterium]